MKNQGVNKPLKSLRLNLKDHQDILRCYLSDAPYGGLVVPCQELLQENDPVELNLLFLDSFESHMIRGAVLWCRKEKTGGFLAAIGFFVTEISARERLLSRAIPKRNIGTGFGEKMNPSSNSILLALDLT